MQTNTLLPKSGFSKACSICFANRKLLKSKIDEIDYELSDSPSDNNTLKELFRRETGIQCILLLVLQMKYQFELYHQIRNDEQDGSKDIQMLLNECNMPLVSLEMMGNHNKEPRIESREETTFVFLEDAGIAINCESLIHFVDKFLDFVIERIKDHPKECSLPDESCIICSSQQAIMEEQIDEGTPLVEQFGTFSNEIPYEVKSETEFIPQSLETDSPNISIEFDHSMTMKESTLQEQPNWERFNDIVLSKYSTLASHYKSADISGNADQQHPVLLLYCDNDHKIKEVRCNSLNQAYKQAYMLNDISLDPFPVVLITPTDNRRKASSPSLTSRKRMVRKCSSKVGTEDSPSQVATLKAPESHLREPFEIELLFYLDTGADSGSVGYNFHIIKHFILTAENINGKLKPAIICEIRVGNHMDEDVHVFDVDEHFHWNAIGLSVLKKYRMYIDIKNNKVELGKHEHVTEVETEDSLQVTFKRDGQMPELSLDSNSHEYL